MRKIPRSLAVIGLLTPLVAPVNAGALGIGDIRLRSNLNQTLLAEIPLVTSGSDSLSDIRISLAPPEAFARAGIERQYFLSKLQFKPLKKPDGSLIIQVTSKDPITEPFLNFLLEVNWPQGHLLREFTALLDPPATYEDKSPATLQIPETTRRAEVFEAPPPVSETKPKSRSARVSTAPNTTKPPVDTQNAGSYGPVRRNETLWSISHSIPNAGAVKPEQLMQMLYEANPNAFVRGNRNLLRAGVTLVVPGVQGEFSSRQSQKQAAIEPSERAPSPPPTTPSQPEPEQPPGAQLKLFTPTEKEAEATKPLTGSGAGTGESAAPAQTLKSPPVEDDVKSRIGELEQKLSALQELLSLKDKQIANLQEPTKPAEQLPAVQPNQPPTKSQGEPPAVAPPTEPAKQPSIATPEPKVPVVPVPAPAPPVATIPAPAKLPAPAKTPAATGEESGGSWLPEPYYLAVGGAGTLLIGALIWVISKRRAAMLDDFESMFPRDAQESAFSEVYANKRPTDEKSSFAEPSSGSKSSFLVEFSASDFDALDTESDELDPISEADVYLAYGRYKQAEDLIKTAIQNHPEREECKLKLLEIHYATENREAFESYAKELYAQKKDSDPEFWGKVTEMGRELCPNSPLFDSGESSVLNIGDDEIGFARDLTNDRSGTDTNTVAPHETPDERLSSFSSFELPPMDSLEDLDAEKLDDSRNDEQSLDFDLSDLATPRSKQSSTPPEPDEKSAPGVGKTKDPMSLDFDFDLLDADTDNDSLSSLSEQKEAPSTSAMSVDFGDLTDMNELETKLDLAKAFVDMDDVEAAREILEEIAKAGSDAQKEEARTLLARIE